MVFVYFVYKQLNLSYDTWFVLFNIFNDPSTLDSSVSSKKSEISRLLRSENRSISKTEQFLGTINFGGSQMVPFIVKRICILHNHFASYKIFSSLSKQSKLTMFSIIFPFKNKLEAYASFYKSRFHF